MRTEEINRSVAAGPDGRLAWPLQIHSTGGCSRSRGLMFSITERSNAFRQIFTTVFFFSFALVGCGKNDERCAKRGVAKESAAALTGVWAADAEHFYATPAFQALKEELRAQPGALTQFTTAIRRFRLRFESDRYTFADASGQKTIPYLFLSGSSPIEIGIAGPVENKGSCRVIEIFPVSKDRIRVRLPGDDPEIEYVRSAGKTP